MNLMDKLIFIGIVIFLIGVFNGAIIMWGFLHNRYKAFEKTMIFNLERLKEECIRQQNLITRLGNDDEIDEASRR